MTASSKDFRKFIGYIIIINLDKVKKVSAHVCTSTCSELTSNWIGISKFISCFSRKCGGLVQLMKGETVGMMCTSLSSQLAEE